MEILVQNSEYLRMIYFFQKEKKFSVLITTFEKTGCPFERTVQIKLQGIQM